jgi:ribosomal-protein-alanine N-acetyltransferase
VTPYRIQPVGRTHARTLAELHAACFPKGWSHLEFESFFERAGVFAGMIYHTNQPVGFVICWLIEDQCDLLAMGVLPDYRRDGIGHHLLDYALATAADMGAAAMVLEVNVNNETAQKLYTDAGFEAVTVRKNYYSHPDGTASDAVCMRKPL